MGKVKRRPPTLRSPKPVAARSLWRGMAIAAPAPLLIALALGLNLPWPLEPAARAALPFLALPVIHWTAFRAPERLPAPLVLLAGLLADLAGDTPLGFWPVLYLAVLASGRLMRFAFGDGLPSALVALLAYGAVALSLAMLLPLAFTLQWPDARPVLAGLGLALTLEAGGVLVASLVPRRLTQARAA